MVFPKASVVRAVKYPRALTAAVAIVPLPTKPQGSILSLCRHFHLPTVHHILATRTDWENSRKQQQAEPGEVEAGYQEKVFHPEGAWALEQAPQGSGHSTKPERVQEAFGQLSQAHGVTLGVFCARPAAGLNDPDGPLPTQHILQLCDSVN